MKEITATLQPAAIRFSELGEVIIQDPSLARQVTNAIAGADIVACTTNNGCGNEVNGYGCGKANAKCNGTIVNPDDIYADQGSGEVRIRNYELTKKFASGKLSGETNFGIAFTGFKK
ncbi:hypothetical protein GBZ26_05210 [Azospirillum formosense]|uniref:Uncharacterized protein n=1 Tax=Azospirillum formosense TaxID=861533 RepID=A0ABX2KSC2_9PROT|nr:hypothetical protein [Azospirillum formosense]MBY3753879.1 hypothetical protein [Azospirillum formosense]NUB18619.1 hypothetical protein [Azospirillum formosense]